MPTLVSPPPKRAPLGWTASAMAVVLAIAPVGCAPRLAGTNDVELTYAVEPDPVTDRTAALEGAARGVKARLAAAHIMADVDPTASAGVRVVVDADLAGPVEDLVVWRGGVGVHLLAGAARPSDAAWRAQITETAPLVTLGLAEAPLESIALGDHGQSLALTLSPEARARLFDARARDADANVALSRGKVLLAVMPLTDALVDPLVVPFGRDLAAYARAERSGALLRSPVLPPLRRTSAQRVAPRWGLAAACAILPFVLSFAWLFFVRRFDRARPEPLWLVVATFALGALSVFPAALIETALATLTPWLDPSLVTFGGQIWGLPVALAVFALTPGAVEEGAKCLAAWSLAGQRREFDEPVDGIVYGCAAALGFAALENVKYFAMGRMSGAVIAARAFMTVPAHMFFGAIWGYAMGRRLVSRRASLPASLALASLAHGAFDASLSFSGTQIAATLIVVALACAFVVMLRRALRHGAVPDQATLSAGDGAPASSLPRRQFPVGSSPAFYASAAGMTFCAFTMTALGAGYELLGHRVGPVFVATATAILSLFGWAAYAVSQTIPLDVVLDARGITFAGVRTPWAAVSGVDVDEKKGKASFVRVHGKGGVLRLGPLRPAAAREMERAMTQAALGRLA